MVTNKEINSTLDDIFNVANVVAEPVEKEAPVNPNPKWYEEITIEDGSIVFMPKQITEPGIYLDMPIDVYHAQLAVSNTGIKQLLKSPWHYWANSALNPSKIPFKVTPALIKGQKFHKYLLERDDFYDDYVLKEKVATSNAIDKKTGLQYVGEGELKDIKTAINVMETLFPNTVKVLLKGALTEVSMFWIDERTGIMCRCRHDIFKPMVSTDYKTSADVSKRDSIRAMASYDYFVQASFYMDGNKAVFRNHLTQAMKELLGLDDSDVLNILQHTNYCFLFQESSSPFTPFALTVEDDMLERGRELYEAGLDTYARSMRKYGANNPWKPCEDKIVGIGKDELEFYGCGYYMHKQI